MTSPILFKALPRLAINLPKPATIIVTRQLSSDRLVNVKRPQPPSRYDLPLRLVSMDDLMEPYGSWKEAYAKDNRGGNFVLARGVVCFSIALLIFFNSGVTEGLMMPNLDNIIEDTEQYKEEMYGIDKTDRATPQ